MSGSKPHTCGKLAQTKQGQEEGGEPRIFFKKKTSRSSYRSPSAAAGPTCESVWQREFVYEEGRGRESPLGEAGRSERFFCHREFVHACASYTSAIPCTELAALGLSPMGNSDFEDRPTDRNTGSRKIHILYEIYHERGESAKVLFLILGKSSTTR